MKIGILTQPLYYNYGGILQAYALQTSLERIGHSVEVLNRESANNSFNLLPVLRLEIKTLFKRLMRYPHLVTTTSQRKAIGRNTYAFIDKYIHRSPSFTTGSQLKNYALSHGFDGYVVGSDQVWRPCNSPEIGNWFIDFDSRPNVKRVAYAASFGVDKWEFSLEETKLCTPLAQRFNAISAREESGIKLCNDYLGANAVHVLDPTMLLDKSDYEKLVIEDGVKSPSGEIFCYVLDEAKEKKTVIDKVSTSLGIRTYTCMPKLRDTYQNAKSDIENCAFPPVTQWLRSFMDAKIVITDSFHGTVFSIIFNRPFWVIGNPERGMARFESLLKMYGLEDRLITPECVDRIDWNHPIDWTVVNLHRINLQKYSLDFLKSNL